LSHIPQRKEKDCLNCGATVLGKYCQVCGQENVEPKETFWHMVTHFLNDITHFDGSFFTTVKDLLFKPGFLSKEYMKGRRASYLHPVRMYVFTSAIFFLLFFSLFRVENGGINNLNKPFDAKQRADYIQSLETRLKNDTGNVKLKNKFALVKDTTRPFTSGDTLDAETDNGKNFRVSLTKSSYKTLEEYDSTEKTLPPAKRDGWIVRRIVKKSIEINSKYKNQQEALEKLGESILHRLPYMLFVSLPLFALILNGVYIRRKWRREFYFADHGVFTIHLYIFSFILLMFVFGLDKLMSITGWSFINFLQFILFVGLFFYLYKAMRKFYGQGRGKTILKLLVVSFLSFIMMVILLVFFMFFSVATL
jgi:ABC-type multidrug transport system fused ATPase/permease subunit